MCEVEELCETDPRNIPRNRPAKQTPETNFPSRQPHFETHPYTSPNNGLADFRDATFKRVPTTSHQPFTVWLGALLSLHLSPVALGRHGYRRCFGSRRTISLGVSSAGESQGPGEVVQTGFNRRDFQLLGMTHFCCRSFEVYHCFFLNLMVHIWLSSVLVPGKTGPKSRKKDKEGIFGEVVDVFG